MAGVFEIAERYDWPRLAPRRCFLCGADGSTTKEHAIPRALYEDPDHLPSDVLVLPAHRTCNRSTEKDEEFQFIAWALANPHPSSGTPRFDRALRALGRERGIGLAQGMADSITEYPNGWAALNVPGLRTHYVIAKMIKGLYYERTGTILGSDVVWNIQATRLDTVVEGSGELIVAHDIVTAKWRRVREDWPETTWWYLTVFGHHCYVVLTYPAREGTKLPVEQRVNSETLPWPRQRR